MVLRALPSLFPSTAAAPKKLRDTSEALVYVLEVSILTNLVILSYTAMYNITV